MATMTRTAAKVSGKAKALGKALSGYSAIFRHLAGEHAEVATLMKRVSGSSDDVQIREELFPEIRRSLLAHAKAEEKEFYEALRAFPRTASMIPQAVEEHRRIESQLDQLQSESCATDAWLETFRSLVRAVEAHVEREENQLFPAASEAIDSDKAKEIEERYAAAEEQEKLRI
jgi:hemerythrin superfamily protein